VKNSNKELQNKYFYRGAGTKCYLLSQLFVGILSAGGTQAHDVAAHQF
jgi:hypothetical protein